MSVYGDIVSGRDVRVAAGDTIKKWGRTYISEIARQEGLAADALPGFRSVTGATDLDAWAEDQLPAAVVVVPGLIEEPKRRGRTWEARWALGIGIVAASTTREATQDLVSRYAAAVRALVLQHPSLGGMASGLAWLGERYDELPTEDQRTIGAGQLMFAVTVEHVTSADGPRDVPADPLADPGDWPQVESTLVTVGEQGG